MDLRNERGQSVQLLKPLTRPGGEGQVFTIANSPTMVAKIYHQPADPQKMAKLRHQLQVAQPDLQKVAAWPTGILLDWNNSKAVRGILMPRMSGKEIHRLYGPADRAVEFPSAGWDYLIHVAMNCGAAFETLHERGIVMADVNEGNLLVTEADARVGLIDCDSYQIRNGNGAFLCDVGIPMWTPPELQGKSYQGLHRTPNHDRFGLAVIIFRLLFMGRHPFAGIPTGHEQFEIQEAIKKWLFAFSPQAWKRGVKPPPLALSLDVIPNRLQRLFERAFLPGSEAANARPTGREWATELRTLLSSLKKGCADPGHKFWNGLTSCPWCAIVGKGGPNFFISVTVKLGSIDWSVEFAVAWAAIERVVAGAKFIVPLGIPSIGSPTPRPMPMARPQQSASQPPTAPVKPIPPAKPVVRPPQLPPQPVVEVPSFPQRSTPITQEKPERLFFLATVFFGLVTLACINWDLLAAAFFAACAAMGCKRMIAVKKAEQRERLRKRRAEVQAEDDRLMAARAELRRVGAAEHAARMVEYEAKVLEIQRHHAAAVAQVEGDYSRNVQQQEDEYQRQLRAYILRRQAYNDALGRYIMDLEKWNAEVSARRLTEEQARNNLNTALNRVWGTLQARKTAIEQAFPALDVARKRFDSATADERLAMQALHQRGRELQLMEFLRTQLIDNAYIANIGPARRATLTAYGVGSALDINDEMSVPGFGQGLFGNLLEWRRSCEARFRFQPNKPLPVAELNAVKVKFAQPRQSAMADLREGAARLENLEKNTREATSQGTAEILALARNHAQAVADLSLCA